MAELKTKKTRAGVKKYLKSLSSDSQIQDCLELLEIFSEVTGEKASMWGPSIVGFGEYHYVYPTGNSGTWPATGFSPRKNNISIYIMPGFSKYETLMEALGEYKTGKSCLYIKSLEKIDQKILKKLIKKSYTDIKKRYPDKNKD